MLCAGSTEEAAGGYTSHYLHLGLGEEYVDDKRKKKL